MGTRTFQRESFADVIDDAMPLLVQHWREIAHYPDIPLDIDRTTYTAMDAAGLLRIYTAREDGRLLGYACYVVGPNPHYARSGLQAKQDVLYIDPAHRRTRLGIRLIDFCDTALAADGVVVVTQHVKLAHPSLGRLLKVRSYEAVETIYSKRLNRSAS